MTELLRSPEPRRTDDAVVQALATKAVDEAISRVLRKAALWFLAGGAIIGGSAVWTVSAWATNQQRDIAANTHRIEAWERASRDQVQAMTALKSAVDSLRITIQIKERAR